MNRREFILKLITEIAHYILEAGPMRMVISLHQEEDGLHLAILDNVQRDETELGKIRRSLNDPGRPELAGYCGSMAGYDSLVSARLNLIGLQVEGADANSTQSDTKIDLLLGGDRFNPASFSIEERANE